MKSISIHSLILLSFLETGLQSFFVVLILLLGSCWMGLSGIFSFNNVVKINHFALLQVLIFFVYIVFISLITFFQLEQIPITITNLFISYIALSFIALIGRNDFLIDRAMVSAIEKAMKLFYILISVYIVSLVLLSFDVGYYQGRMISPGNAIFGIGDLSDSHSFSMQYAILCVVNLIFLIGRNPSKLKLAAFFCFSLYCISLIGSRSGSLTFLLVSFFLSFKYLDIRKFAIIGLSSMLIILLIIIFDFNLNSCPPTTADICSNRSFSFDPNSDSARLSNLSDGAIVFGESSTWLFTSPSAFLGNKQFYDMFALNALLSIGLVGILYISIVFLSRPFFRVEYIFPLLAVLFLLSEFILLPRILILLSMCFLIEKSYYDKTAT